MYVCATNTHTSTHSSTHTYMPRHNTHHCTVLMQTLLTAQLRSANMPVG